MFSDSDSNIIRSLAHEACESHCDECGACAVYPATVPDCGCVPSYDDPTDQANRKAHPLTIALGKYVDAPVISWLDDCDEGEWTRAGDDTWEFHFSNCDEPTALGVTFCPTRGEVTITEAADEQIGDYMPATLGRVFCNADDPYRCGCSDCRDEVMLERARRTEEGATL